MRAPELAGEFVGRSRGAGRSGGFVKLIVSLRCETRRESGTAKAKDQRCPSRRGLSVAREDVRLS